MALALLASDFGLGLVRNLAIPRNLVKFALNSDLCQFDHFRPKINMGGDREVVVIMQLSICTLHTIFVDPIRVKPQNFTILTRNKLVP